MNRQEYAHLQAELVALDRMIAETPDDDVISRTSLVSRREEVEAEVAGASVDERELARARLTFQGKPVVGSHGIVAEFGARAVTGFTDTVAMMAASLAGPLRASGPIPNKEQHQLLITSTALGSFGFELEEHPAAQLRLDGPSAVAQALDRTRDLLQGTLGSDEQLADSVAEVDPRAVDKLRAFLQLLADAEAACAVQIGETRVAFTDVGQVRTSLSRLSRENLREETQTFAGELLGVLPEGRLFELKVASDGQVIRGKIGPGVANTDALSRRVHESVRVEVMVTRVGKGRPRYVLQDVPE